MTGKTFWIHVLVEQKDRISYFQWNFLITIKSCIFDVTEAYIRLNHEENLVLNDRTQWRYKKVLKIYKKRLCDIQET